MSQRVAGGLRPLPDNRASDTRSGCHRLVPHRRPLQAKNARIRSRTRWWHVVHRVVRAANQLRLGSEQARRPHLHVTRERFVRDGTSHSIYVVAVLVGNVERLEPSEHFGSSRVVAVRRTRHRAQGQRRGPCGAQRNSALGEPLGFFLQQPVRQTRPEEVVSKQRRGVGLTLGSVLTLVDLRVNATQVDAAVARRHLRQCPRQVLTRVGGNRWPHVRRHCASVGDVKCSANAADPHNRKAQRDAVKVIPVLGADELGIVPANGLHCLACVHETDAVGRPEESVRAVLA
mmetsp:Transcript_23269/g.56824  ORF Transcript_23269/g.56824 Transcript_23269/m.56824 type:complete len:288 (+) Transcript_23269:16-879(+)